MSINDIYEKLRLIKPILSNDGINILGVFGSYARNENLKDSDVDILYHLDKIFYDKYSGFIGFKKLDEIKQFISEKLDKKIDLAPSSNLSKTAKTHILKDVIYV